MVFKYIKFIASILVFTLASTGAPQAATCNVNLEVAYNRAVAKGWTFKCVNSVFVFNNDKKPGCRARSIVMLPAQFRFFQNNAHLIQPGSGDLLNGWKITDYTVSGGQWSRLSPNRRGTKSARIIGEFKVDNSRWHQRFLTSVTVEKSGTGCKGFYLQAF